MSRNYSSTAGSTTLTSPINDSQTTMAVGATTGFPAAPFVLAIDGGTVSQELVLVTAVASLNLTVTRGYDSTSAMAHTAGATVEHSHAAIDFREAAAHADATSGVHGLSGAPVGTSDSQTLTNKTLGSSNTVNGFTASKIMVSDGTGKLTASTAALPSGTPVGTTDTQTLTNKNLSSGTNTFPATLATTSGLSTAVSDHAAVTATHGATGAVVGTTNTQTLTNKTLTAPVLTTPTIDGLSISGAWTSYVPVWTNSSGSAPDVGNGTLSGASIKIGRTVHFRITLKGGSTTNYQTGRFEFTLPHTAVYSGTDGPRWSFNTDMLDGSAVYSGRASTTSSTKVALTAPPTTAGTSDRSVSASVPFTFGTGSLITIWGSYEATS